MTDLRERIAAVLALHVEDQLTNYDAGRTECGCGAQGSGKYNQHVADAVIAELGMTPEIGWNDTYPVHRKLRYVTDWQPDE